MNNSATQSIYGVNIVVFLVEALIWTAEDDLALNIVKKAQCPVILAINKIDTLPIREKLLAYLESVKNKMDFAAIIPISAKKSEQVNILENSIAGYLPESDFIFPEDQLTDRSERFLASEIIREKLTHFLHQELPYALTVEIEQFEYLSGLYRISALILVETEGQKAIVIGENGKILKKIGSMARLNMEKLFGSKVFLQLWVKTRRGWPDDDAELNRQGY
jgi:GTP-binding protein Era